MLEDDPKESGFLLHQGHGIQIGDPEIISCLKRAAMCSSKVSLADCRKWWGTIFSLVWGWEIGHRGAQFPGELAQTVLSIEEHTKKKEEASDTQECELHSIILDLLQVTYEKQVSDVVDIILKGRG